MSRSRLNSLIFLLCAAGAFATTTLLLYRPWAPSSPSSARHNEPVRSVPGSVDHPAMKSTVAMAAMKPETELHVPDVLSSFQRMSLASPAEAGRLVSELIGAVRDGYSRARACYGVPERTVLEFQIKVRSSGSRAEILSTRFGQVKEGAPVDAGTISCISRELDERRTIRSPSSGPFPAEFEDEVPMVFAFP